MINPINLCPILTEHRELANEYYTTKRFYHGINHISWMWKEAQNYFNMEELFLVNLKIVAHDLIYDSYGDNELRSSEVFCEWMRECGYSDDIIKEVRRFVLSTIDHFDDDYDQQNRILRDLDLAYGLGQTYETFIKNSNMIRLEYKNVSDEEFKINRNIFLKKVINRDRIYSVLDHYEGVTRTNISKFLKDT